MELVYISRYACVKGRWTASFSFVKFFCFGCFCIRDTGVHEQLETEHSLLKTDLLEAQETCQVSVCHWVRVGVCVCVCVCVCVYM